jgi:chorismate-pyruvate lyase
VPYVSEQPQVYGLRGAPSPLVQVRPGVSLQASDLPASVQTVAEVPACAEKLAAFGLDAIDRVLLSGDGTVTHVLEAAVGERIETRTLRQSGPAPLSVLEDHTGVWWLPRTSLIDPSLGEELIVRRVVLRGAASKTPYVLAESLAAPDRLGPGVAGKLARAGASIGRELRSARSETRREVLEVGRMRAGEAADLLSTKPDTRLAWRTYRILQMQRVVFVITEMIVPGRISEHANAGTPARGG